MAQPRQVRQRPISKEEKLAWIYGFDLHKRTNPTDKSQQAYEMNPQTITEMGSGSACSAPTPCNITPPVVSSSLSDRNFHMRSMMNSESSFQAQSTDYQHSPSQPLGGSHSPSKTQDRSNRHNHDWERILENLKKPVAQPEIEPLGSERVRNAARKEVRRRQVDNKNTRMSESTEQAGPGQGPEIPSREPDITRLEAVMDEQMRDVRGAIDRIESKAEFRLWGPQYRGTMDLAGPKYKPADESSQTQHSMEGLSTCYYWDKHQKDSTQPPCQLGLACRFPHCCIGGTPGASTHHKPDTNPPRGLSPATVMRRHRKVTEGHHVRQNAPSFRPPLQVGHSVSRKPIDKTPLKYSPPPRPSGPSPLGSSQRSMAQLRVPQVSLPLRSKVKSAPPVFQDKEVNIFGEISLGNSQRGIHDMHTSPKKSFDKRDEPSDTSSPFASARHHSSSYFSRDFGTAQQMSEGSKNTGMGMGLITRRRRKLAAEQALAEEEQYRQWFEDNQLGFKAPFKISHQGTSIFALDPHVCPLSTSSPEYKTKNLEREFRESEERCEKEINERARVGSVGPKASPEPEDRFKTAFMNVLNAGEEGRRFSYDRGRESELRDTPKGHPCLKDMRNDGTSKGTLSSDNVLERPAMMAEQPAPNNEPLAIRPRPINPHKQATAPGTAAPESEQLDNKPTFHKSSPISGPLKQRSLPANECQELFHRLLINPLASINFDPKVKQPKCQPLNMDETQRPIPGPAKKKLTHAEAGRRQKLAEQNSKAKREMLHSAGGTRALNGAVGENIQTALGQPEVKEEDIHFSDVDLGDKEEASEANGEEGEDWIVVENTV